MHQISTSLLPTQYIDFYWCFTQIKIGPILVYTRSFKSVEETGENQESSFPTNAMFKSFANLSLVDRRR